MGRWGGASKGAQNIAANNIGEKPEAKGRIYLKKEGILKEFQGH